ncbi:hypothetical protein K449DRAFT_192735 [Hypoxylon sp. EC38]|nr:hypothetical protein K449DRAFT_192735 [Hypoxylon sp. EC38]
MTLWTFFFFFFFFVPTTTHNINRACRRVPWIAPPSVNGHLRIISLAPKCHQSPPMGSFFMLRTFVRNNFQDFMFTISSATCGCNQDLITHQRHFYHTYIPICLCRLPSSLFIHKFPAPHGYVHLH